MRRAAPLFLFASVVALTSPAGCVAPLDTTREMPVRGTLGEEIYRNVCQRISSSELPTDVSGFRTAELCAGRSHTLDDGATPPARLGALDHNRARLVLALDAALPDDLHDDLRGFLLELLPLYDPPESTLPEQTRAVATLLLALITDPPPAVPPPADPLETPVTALTRFGHHEGYRPLRLGLGVMKPVLGYPHFDDVASTMLAALDTGGSAADALDTMLRAVALSMASADRTTTPAGTTSTLELTRQLMFTEDDAFASGTPRWVVRRDARGFALPQTTGGTVIAPFVDVDGNGLADVDANGAFLGGAGGPLDVATPFPILGEPMRMRDPYGRALAADGTVLYQTMDVNRTFLAGLAREAHPWLDPMHPSVLDLAQGLPLLLGPRTMRTASFGTATIGYLGPDTSRGALFDLLHATGAVLGRPETEDLLAVTNTLLTDHESALAGVIAAAWYGSDSGDMHPGAALEQPNDLWDDLLLVGEHMAQEPGFLDDIIRASGDPAAADLGGVNAMFMRYTDPVVFDPANVNGVPLPAGALTHPTNWDAPDSMGNESLFQRSLLAIDDLNGVRVCNKENAYVKASILGLTVTWPLIGAGYHECELFQIDNVAEFYSQAVIGEDTFVIKPGVLNAIISFLGLVGVSEDALLESSSGITGLTTHPTPQALARLVFAQPPYGPPNDFVANIIDDTSTKRQVGGTWRVVPVAARHHDVVPAWEKTFLVNGHDASFLSALRPLMVVFMHHDPPGGRFLFGEMVHALTLHWPSRMAARTQRTDPTADLYSEQDDGRSYEPVVADLFDRGLLFQRLAASVHALSGITLRPGVDGVKALADGAAVLIDPQRSCAGGSCATGTPLTYRDGRAWPCSNTGTCWDGAGGRPRRYVSPMYLLLDALKGFDDAFAPHPDTHTKWLDARHVITNQLLRTSGGAGSERLTARRAYALLRTTLPFLRQRLAEHRAAGDIDAWATGLTARAETSFGSAETSTTLDLVQALQDDPGARMQLASLAQYLFDESSPNDAFDSTIVGGADMLQVLSDDDDMVPLVRALSSGLAPNALDAVRSPAVTVSTTGSAAHATVHALRAMSDADTTHALRRALSGLVTTQSAPGSDPVTPLETILDVISEVNRASPGAGGTFLPDDYRTFLGRTHDFLTDHDRGFERLYDIVHCRTVAACPSP